MKRLHRLFMASALLVLLTSASFAGDMHSDVKRHSTDSTITQPAGALEIPETEEAEAGYLEVIVDALGTLLSSIY